ncbi:MAG: hypothetical protein WCK34_03500 [Bacteroidota bacterium]
MPESTTKRSHSVSHSRKGFYHSDLYITYLKPASYMLLAISFVVVAKLLHASTWVALFGALGIILLTVAKTWKRQFGVFLSMVCLVMMIMINLWHWADSFFITVFSGNFTADKSIFSVGITEGLIVIATVWFYQNLLKNLNMHVSHEWYVKKSQLKFLKLLFFFEMFLLFFWLAGYSVNLFKAGNHYDGMDVTIIAGVIALIAAGVPAVIYLFRTPESHARHRHRSHQKRHHSAGHSD